MQLTKLFHDFFASEKAGGLILVLATILSVSLANSPWQSEYSTLWNLELGNHSLQHWINDGLMTIFFLLIGLELEREIYIGELSNIKNAALPIFGALGGMLFPALFFLLLNFGTATQSGIGIPMATDIAFAIGILSLLGSRIPASLKVFLTALAVIDDLGAIIVIAVFYTKSLSFFNLGIALGIFGVLLLINRLKVRNLIPYLFLGALMWYFMLQSGVHATITGVMLAFAIPFGNGDQASTSYILQDFLHKPVAFVILPLFALANTSIVLESDWTKGIFTAGSLGIIAGLVIGKPLGILSFSWLGSKLKLCDLPADLNWKSIIGVGFLGGIGFTMSIFITLLAFDDAVFITESKIAILLASTFSAIIGLLVLKQVFQKANNQ